MKDVLIKYRESEDLATLNRFKYQKEGYWDSNYWDRSELIFELYIDFSESDKSLIKWLIDQELNGAEDELPIETLQVCAFMLYKIMAVEDVYDLYNVKFGGGTDLQCHTDTELIFGIDKEQTKIYLKNNPSESSEEVLDCIKYYEGCKGAIYKSREEYITYFETKRFKMLKEDFEDTKEDLIN